VVLRSQALLLLNGHNGIIVLAAMLLPLVPLLRFLVMVLLLKLLKLLLLLNVERLPGSTGPLECASY
jgi:hypothetical protein